MKELLFATTNSGKVATLQACFDLLGDKVKVVGVPLELIEPQAEDALKVAESKAVQAFDQLKKPVVVDDSALHIPSLAGFPGVYQKYVLDTIGPDGILKLMQGVEDRSAYFISNLVYIDEESKKHSFSDTHYDGVIAATYDPSDAHAWGAFGKIFIPVGTEKALSQLSSEEQNVLKHAAGFIDAYDEFAKWYVSQRLAS